VTNANSFWFVDANLHLWVDRDSNQTVGGLTSYKITPNATITAKGHVADNLDANFTTTAHRTVSVSGWVRTSMCKVQSDVNRVIKFQNVQKYTNGSNVVSWTQNLVQSATTITTSVPLRPSSSSRATIHVHTETDDWPFSGWSSYTPLADNGFLIDVHIDQGRVRRVEDSRNVRVEVTRRRQIGEGSYGTTGKGVRIGGPTELETTLKLRGIAGCYERKVVVNQTRVLSDKVDQKCQ
ncbi:hypothetical protein BC938DRAFT_475592, partial [Jimgerdemannia flammicorona]